MHSSLGAGFRAFDVCVSASCGAGRFLCIEEEKVAEEVTEAEEVKVEEVEEAEATKEEAETTSEEWKDEVCVVVVAEVTFLDTIEAAFRAAFWSSAL